MSKDNAKVKILISDPSEDFQGLMARKEDPIFSICEVVYTSKGSEAIEKIKATPNEFAGILVSSKVENPDPVSIFKVSMHLQPAVPIVYLDSLDELHFSDEELDSIGVRELLTRPFEWKDVMKAFAIEDLIYCRDKALDVSEKYKDEKVDSEIDDQEDGFEKIPAAFFVSVKDSLFDVYVKIRKGKFVKIVKAGDSFEPEKVKSYIEKGVIHFFIRKESQEEYVKYCDFLASKASQSKRLKLNQKFSLLANQAETTLSLMSQMGVNNASVRYAKRYAKNSMNVINTLSEKSKRLNSFLADLKNFEHSMAVSTLGCLILKEMKINSQKNLELFSLASFFHDVGLQLNETEANVLGKKDGSFLDEEELKERLNSKKVFGEEKSLLSEIWLDHGKRGAEQLREIEDISEVVRQVISNHHPREFSQSGLGQGTVHPLSEVLEAANLMAQELPRLKSQESKTIVSVMTSVLKDLPRRISEPAINIFRG